MKITQIIGLVLVLGAVLLLTWFRSYSEKKEAVLPPVTVRGYVGGEKMGLVQNPKIQKILLEKYRVTLRPEKRGSVEMVISEPLEGIDFVWPGSQVQLEMYRQQNKPMVASEILFNSPIVIYSWDLVEAALSRSGIVEKENQTYYVVKMPDLIQVVTEKKKWKEMGVPELFGSVKVACTDPLKSNSGNQFVCLTAIVLVGGETLQQEDLPKVVPTLKNFLKSLGYLHSSSGDFFNQYLKQGMGAYPLAAGYENQIIEFSLQNREFLKSIQSKLRILYPRPTVWSSHPMIAVNAQGKRLLVAMQDPQIQAIAWEEHGFRTGNASITLNAQKLGIPGIPDNITSIVSMPSAQVVEQLIQQTKPQ